MAQLPVLVIKFGTASITHPDGEPDESVIASIAEEVAALKDQHRVVLVSSGAVGAGKSAIRDYQGTLNERKAAAAVGNPILLQIYARFFARHGIRIAQSLCERHHFANRRQFLQLKETYQELWNSGIIPIANENDVVSNLELKFSDNDELATLIASGFGAEALLISTSVGGLLDVEGNIIPRVEDLSPAFFGLVRTEKSALGLGGMLSKLTYTRLATRLGIRVVFFNVRTPNGISKALSGETGTDFLPQLVSLSSRQKWLSSGSLISGRLTLDAGAVKAIAQRKSLLAVGVRRVKGTFERNEVIELADSQNNVVAIARVKRSAAEIVSHSGTTNYEIAHADDIVLLL
ncbi:MAG: glutamate 5-kinase [Haliscomenobacter sp.]|nr:glutamate 5-kinase [Haliscomenobacter sp.]MBK7475962.1 glutamate 5-kinase [Haliscomenobacter sp.]MBK8877916.1 glutamate 5-kinase [Haliscomenobacter sp.]